MAVLTVPAQAAEWSWSTDGSPSAIRTMGAGTAAWAWDTSGGAGVRRTIPEATAEWVFSTVGADNIVRRELLPSSGVSVQVWDMLNPLDPSGFLAVIQYRDLKFEKVHSDTGSFEITLARSYLGAEWLVKDNVIKITVEGILRWAGYIEDVVEVPVSEDERRSIKLVGRGIGKALEWGAIAPANFGQVNQRTKRLWTQTARGKALYDLFTEIQARGTIPWFTLDGWSDLVGSDGLLWSPLVDLEFDAGGSFLELLQQWVNFDIEWSVDPDFRFALGTYLGRDISDTVVVYPANTITSQENTITRRDIRTQMFTEDGNAEVSLIEDTAAVQEWGQREQYVVFKDALGQGTTTASGFAFLNLVKDQVIERRVSIDPFAPGRRPFLDFDTGDTIGAEFGGEVFEFRVLAIALGVDENGRTKAEITLDYVLEAQRRRRLALLNASSAGGGTSSGPQLVYGISLGVIASTTPALTCEVILESFIPTYGKAGFVIIGTASGPGTVTVDLVYDFGIVKSFPFYIPAAGVHTLDVTYLWLGIPEGTKLTWLRIVTNGPSFTVNPLDAQYWIEAKGIAGSVQSSPNSTVDDIVPGGTALTDLYPGVIDSASTSDASAGPVVVGETALELVPYPDLVDEVGPTQSGEIELGITEFVVASSDDGTVSSSPSFSSVDSQTTVGLVSGVTYDSFHRFVLPPALNLKGATITAAWISGVSTVNSTVVARTVLTLADEANPTTITDRADYFSRTRVSALPVTWETNQTAGTTYNSPNFAAALQELVDSYDDPGAILVFHQNDGSPPGGRISLRSFETPAPNQPVVLRFRYVPAPLPVAAFERTPSSGITDSTVVTFDPSTSFHPDPSISIVSYSWNFGDGSPAVVMGTDDPVTHTYDSAGNYLTVLTITDSNGQTATEEFYTLVSGPASSNGASSFHAWWDDMTNPAKYEEASVTLRVLADPPVMDLYFWAFQVDFIDSGSTVLSGAHVGLQWHRDYPSYNAVNWGGYRNSDGTILAGSTSALPSALNNANTRNFAWDPNTDYRFRVFKPGGTDVGQPAGTTKWRATVTNLTTGVTTTIRDLYAFGDRINGMTMWSEVFAECSDPSVSVQWKDGSAVVFGTATVQNPARWLITYQSLASGGCHNTNTTLSGGVITQTTGTLRTQPHNSIVP